MIRKFLISFLVLLSLCIFAASYPNNTSPRQTQADNKMKQKQELEKELNDKTKRLTEIESKLYSIEKENIKNLPAAAEAFARKWKEFLVSDMFKRNLSASIIKQLGITESQLDDDELEECRGNIKQILDSFIKPTEKIEPKNIGDTVTISVYMKYNEQSWTGQKFSKVGVFDISGEIKKFDNEAVHVITTGAIKKIPFTSIVETQRAAYDPKFAEEMNTYLSKNIKTRIQELNRLFRQLNFNSLLTGLEESRINKDWKKGDYYVRQFNLIQSFKDELISWQFVLFQDISDSLKPYVLDKAIVLSIENESNIDFKLKILNFNIIYSGYFDMLVDSPDQAETWMLDRFDSFAAPDFCIRRNKSMYLIDDTAFSQDAVEFKRLNEERKALQKEIDDLNARIKNLEYDTSIRIDYGMWN